MEIAVVAWHDLRVAWQPHYGLLGATSLQRRVRGPSQVRLNLDPLL